ncbi:hypothetical protein GCM10022225_74370 [Plantactinospora mayteni]|uniref:Uncharacterized protein n=1 Tax=Plantactinospora mayteni TaxID=566021 RepID=A0ABQ4EW66_9ACTN|nr:hypothetical protein [Plantactinospora mayteni]GIG98905.1 hypothetical protein Pma05_54780 [Plantactinospora mayteni]
MVVAEQAGLWQGSGRATDGVIAVGGPRGDRWVECQTFLVATGLRRTYQGLAERLAQLGIESDTRAVAGLVEIRQWADLDEERDAGELMRAFGPLGIGVRVPGKVDNPAEGYRMLLERAVACSGGSVVIDDIELVEDEDGEQSLHFRRDGQSYWWALEHRSPRCLDLEAIREGLDDLTPGGTDPRGFYQVDGEDDGGTDCYVLLTPEQAEALREEFGLPVARRGSSGPPAGAPAAEPDTLGWYMEDDRRYLDPPARRSLDEWLGVMDVVLERWRNRHLPDDFPFDFSLDSLAALERLMLDRFDSPEAVRAAAGDEFVDGAVRYLGETAVRAWPCRWGHQYSDSGSGSVVSIPVIRSNTPDGFLEAVAPLDVLRFLARDRAHGTLAYEMGIVEDALDRYRKALRARAR